MCGPDRSLGVRCPRLAERHDVGDEIMPAFAEVLLLRGERRDDQRRVTEWALDVHLHRFGAAGSRERPDDTVPPVPERLHLPAMEREQALAVRVLGEGARRVNRELDADAIEIGTERQARLPIT